MARDADDPTYVTPTRIGDLQDVGTPSSEPADKSTFQWDATDDQWEAVAPSAAIANLSAITGGEAPTEAEFNALVTAFNSLLAACRTHGVIASS